MKLYTSYFGNLRSIPEGTVCISIALTQPKSMRFRTLPELNPTWDMLNNYKADGDWSRYTRDYKSQVLATLNPADIVHKIMLMAGGRDAVLLCWEGKDKDCHRHIVTQWLRDAGYHIEEV